MGSKRIMTSRKTNGKFNKCCVEGCDSDVASVGMCQRHYLRKMKHGDPLAGGVFRKRHGPICTVANCRKAARQMGLCNAHYSRLYRNGSPTGGNPTPGFAIKFIADVIAAPPVDHCIPWPFARNRDGYGQIDRDGRPQLASRIVCIEKHGPPPFPKAVARHLCGKGHEGCVNPAHIAWGTYAQNAADRLIHGTSNRGERCGSAKLTDDEVRAIRKMGGTASQLEIAGQFGVSRGNIHHILKGDTWRHLL